MLAHVRDVLRTPGALPLFAASCVARLPMGALGLLLVLHGQALTGSYAAGGLAAGGYAPPLGPSNPAPARGLARRRPNPPPGRRAVVRGPGAPLAATAIVVLALLPAGTPRGAIVAAAIVAGLSQPPVGGCRGALGPGR